MKRTGDVQILFGPEGIEAAYEMSLQTENLDIVCLSNEYEQVIGDYFEKKYAPRLYGSGIKTREVLFDTEGNREAAEKKDRTRNRVKFLREFTKSESDCMVTGDKVILISYNAQKPYALIIEDSDLVANFQNQFSALWKSL